METPLNHLAIVAGALLSLAVGALWYSPLLFFKAWQVASGVTDEQVARSNPAVTYSITLVLALIISYNLAFFLAGPDTDWQWGATAGFLAGFGFATAAFGIVAVFEQRRLSYTFVNGGFIVVYFTLLGLLLGAWR